MSIKSVNNQSFRGNLRIYDLSAKQQKVFDKITPILKKYVEPTKHLNFNISGSCDKNIIAHYRHREPKYLHMSTQIADATVPVAETYVEGTDPKTILKAAKELIVKHVNSEYYQNYQPPKPSLFDRVLDYFKRAFMF